MFPRPANPRPQPKPTHRYLAPFKQVKEAVRLRSLGRLNTTPLALMVINTIAWAR